jgi:hypothetical protein
MYVLITYITRVASLRMYVVNHHIRMFADNWQNAPKGCLN